jgi:hypothetical protein
MAATHIGLTAGQITWGTSASIEVDDNGGWTVQAEGVVSLAGTNLSDVLALLPAQPPSAATGPIGTLIDWVSLTAKAASREEGEIATLRATWKGSPTELNYPDEGQTEDETAIRYELRGTTSEEPILTHPNVKAMGAEDQKRLQLLVEGKVVPNPDYDGSNAKYVSEDDKEKEIEFGTSPASGFDGSPLTFADLIASGVEQYLVPRFVWTRRWKQQKPFTAAQLNAIGQVTTPPGSPPTAAGRSWLFTSASQTREGESYYELEAEWTLSGQGGWEALLYDNP